MRIEADLKLDYSDVLLRPKRSTLGSRKDVSVERRYTFRNYKPNDMSMENIRPESNPSYDGVPIMAANMDGVGTFEMADTLADLGMFTCLVKTYEEQELKEFFTTEKRTEHVAYSMGITKKDLEKFRNVYSDKIKFVCVDVANGYTKFFSEYISDLRKEFPNIVIIAGNVVTGDQTQELILSGADIVKVGIGPGSVCTTRIQTGVGYPQLSAVIECADAAHGLGGHVIADGGCTCPGDVAKAFAGGADFVMLGGMLAGHDQGGGEVITKHYKTGEYTKSLDDGMNGEIPSKDVYTPVVEEKKFVQFYGMSSNAANTKHFGGLKDYRSSEGREVLVPYRGDVAATVQDLLGGIRSTCTYAGALRLKHLMRCTTFVRCTQQFNGIYATDDK
jgi:GMP reductase